MHSNSGYTSSRVVALLVMAVTMLVPTAQGEPPKDCRLYQVTLEKPSPIFEVSVGNDTYISLGLLFKNSIATINIFKEGTDIMVGDGTTSQSITDGDPSNSCQMTVNKENGTLEGSCFNDRDISLKCTQDEGMDTIILRRRGPLLIAFIDGDSTNTNVLTISASNIVNFQVTSDTFVNTVINCPSNCFQFNNGIIHSIFDLGLSAKQIATEDDGNSTGVIKVLHGEDLDENMSFNFSYPQNNDQDDGGNLWNNFYVTSQYKTLNDSTHSLSVSGSLIGSEDPVSIGYVPTLDTYFKFEDMDKMLWTACIYNPVTEGHATESMLDVTKGMTISSSVDTVKGVTEETTTASDYQNTEDYEIESEAGVTIKETGEQTTVLPVERTTKRFVEEISCKDTRDPKCTLTKDQGGSCNCAEAKENGWCNDLENHKDIKENCKKTCGLCPHRDGVLNGGPDVPEIANEIEGRENVGRADSSIDATKPPNTGTAGGNIFVYVMIGIVVVMVLVLIIWLTCKKRKASGHMDLEGQSQSMSLKESTEKTSENNKDTEKINKQEKEDNNEGAKNNAFQEQDEVKDKTKVNDETANVDDGSKGAGENSLTKDEDDRKNTDDKSPTNNEIEHATEKDIEDKVNNEEDRKDDINQRDDSPNGEPEKNDKAENGNENASKGITDSLENEKTIE